MATQIDVSRGGDLNWRCALSLDGEPVAWLYIGDRTMRIGCAEVRMAGIGGVWTEPEHRRQGYMRQVMDRTVEFMADEGFDVSLLFGIVDFYPRWGYATTIPRHELSIATDRAVRAAGTLAARPFEVGDMPRILRIYNRCNALRTGSVVRRPATWPERQFPKGTRFSTRVDLFVVENERDAIVGYWAVDTAHVDRDTGEVHPITDAVRVAEVNATDERAFDTVLAELGQRATARGVKRIECRVPVDHPFALHCRSFGGELTLSTAPDGGAMMRIIDLDGLLGALEDELSRRVAGRGLSGTLRVETDLGGFGITVSDRSARICSRLSDPDYSVRLQQWQLMQLLMGYRTLEDALADPREAAFAPDRTPPTGPGTPRALSELGAALFPPHHSYCWRPDWF